MSNICRCCGEVLSEKKPLLRYKNMPKAAQFFPTDKEVNDEKGVDIEIVQCSYCGLLQIPREPVPYYKDVIRASGVSEEMRQFREKQFSRFVETYGISGKKVIEIGAGSGEYMKMFQVSDAVVYGIENKHESVEKALNDGLNVYEGFIENRDYKIENGPYKGFYIMNFLEHIPEPNEFLKGIFNNLEKDGVGIVEVPNVNMMLDKLLFSEFISDHLMYFTKNTLSLILEKNGFEVLDCREIWYNYIISATVRKKSFINTFGFEKQRKFITESVNSYIDMHLSAGRKVCVWGAGHQALADISLMDIGNKIECVVDSAEFKQNKYTPATHIPVLSPQILEKGEIQAVLIIGGGYSDEIAGIIKSEYDISNIAILRDYGIEVIDA